MGGTEVNRTVWVEGLLLIAIGGVSFVESVRLVLYRDPTMMVDMLGPGYYLLLMSVGMLISGGLHIYHHRHEGAPMKQKTSKEGRIRLISSFVVCTTYVILISIFGYFISTIAFFVLMFRIVGIRSWIRDLVLSVLVSVGFYVVFVKYCDMTFPRGIFF